MLTISKLAALAAGVFLPAMAFGQEGNPPAGEPQAPGLMCVTQTPPRPVPADTNAKQDKKQEPDDESGLGKDVGSAVGGTAGQIAGATVAGPIGAAAGGVVVEKVGRAVGSVLKTKGRKKQKQGSAEQQPATPRAEISCVEAPPAP